MVIHRPFASLRIWLTSARIWIWKQSVAIAYAELEYGVAVSTDPEREGMHLAGLVEDITVAAFDSAAAVAYGPIRLATRDSKKDHLNKLIAAHAVSLGAILVTNNTKDLSEYPGLVIENWLVAGDQAAPY